MSAKPKPPVARLAEALEEEQKKVKQLKQQLDAAEKENHLLREELSWKSPQKAHPQSE